MADMNDYEKQQLQDAVAALRTGHYTAPTENDTNLCSRGNIEYNDNDSVKPTGILAEARCPPIRVPAGDVQPHQDLIDGQLLDAVTSASAVDEANTLVQLRNAVEAHQSPRSASFDRQSRMAEQAVSLMDPPTNRGKRKISTDQGSDATDDANEVPDNVTIDLTFQDQSRNKRQKFVNNDNHEAHVGLDEPNQAHQFPQPDRSDQPLPADQFDPPLAVSPLAEEDNIFVTEYPQISTVLSEARIAAGIYSAAALFRKPNAMTKKYTRPPMSKLFADLELTPEDFLQLQAQAKNYMLEETRPERRDCVGNRAKGDTDMNRLKLFHCVREFLEPGLGTFYFGPNSEGSGRRKWSWPEDANKVIAAVTPLLRRMVTNERQRQYANESRKTSGKKKAEKEISPAVGPVAVQDDAPQPLDLMLGYGVSAKDDTSELQQPEAAADTLVLHFIVMESNSESNQRHVVARFDCPASMCDTYASLQSYVYTATAVPETQATESDIANTTTCFPPEQLPTSSTSETTGQVVELVPPVLAHVMPSISAFLPSCGLWVLQDEADWSNAVEEARNTVWMEQVLKIVVEAPVTV